MKNVTNYYKKQTNKKTSSIAKFKKSPKSQNCPNVWNYRQTVLKSDNQ